jgi:hypothetical protein
MFRQALEQRHPGPKRCSGTAQKDDIARDYCANEVIRNIGTIWQESHSFPSSIQYHEAVGSMWDGNHRHQPLHPGAGAYSIQVRTPISSGSLIAQLLLARPPPDLDDGFAAQPVEQSGAGSVLTVRGPNLSLRAGLQCAVTA